VAVEAALVTPLLVMLVFGTIDFGWMINRDTLINNAAREGAREGSLNPDATTVTTVVKSYTAGLDQSDLSVNVTCRKPDSSTCTMGSLTATAPTSGDVIIVSVDFNYRWITPVGRAFGSTMPLSKTAEMRIE
jgi:Flp pilus assembly protein TadG